MLKALPMSSFAKLSWSHGNGNCDVQYKKTADAEWTLVNDISTGGKNLTVLLTDLRLVMNQLQEEIGNLE